jgi:hypothetical protein
LCLIGPDIQAKNFARLALCENLKRSTANLAVGGESLGRDAGIDDDLEALSAIGALDGFRYQHVALILLTILASIVVEGNISTNFGRHRVV